MQHSSKLKPRIFPINGDTVPSEIDRAQAIDPTISTNREKVEEIGRVLPVGYVKKSPTLGYRLTQYEYGSIEFWQKLINSDVLGNDGETEIAISDFKTPYFDVCAYLTDDSIWIIKLGCYTRELKEWENDFWNNYEEYPNDGSEKSKHRLELFKMYRNIIEGLK